MNDEDFGETGCSGYHRSKRRCLRCPLVADSSEREVATHLTISDSGASVVAQELGVRLDLQEPDLAAMLKANGDFLGLHDIDYTKLVANAKSSGQLAVHYYKNYFTPIASGSFLTRGMVICPCSGSTLSGIAHAASQKLDPASGRCSPEGAPKTHPSPSGDTAECFSIGEHAPVAQAGAVVLPAAPGWYHSVNGMLDLVDFVVARILDQLDVPHQLMERWKETEE